MEGPPAIAVWTAALAGLPEELWPRLLALLDDEERARAARFHFERHRRQHVAAHALKRIMLSRLSAPERPPGAWAFEAAPGGKPRVARGQGAHFNISHCGGLVACAVSAFVEVGVDIEPLDPAAPLELARSHFAAAEARWLAGLPPAERAEAFLRLWTLKEAYIKATGLGLAQSLQDFAFSFAPLRISFLDPALRPPTQWRFAQQRLPSGHLLALAWRPAPEAATPPAVASVDLAALLPV